MDVGDVNRRQTKHIIEILERDDNIDNLVVFVRVGKRWRSLNTAEEAISMLANVRKSSSKPVMSVIPFSSPEEMREARDIARKLCDEGIPAFDTLERAARALRNALDYYSAKNRLLAVIKA